MTNIEILRTFNDWRRDRTGNRTLEDFGITPRMIGEALDAVIKDAERLDWFDMECEGYGFEDIQEGNRWVIDGPFRTVRDAIDAAISKESRQ